MTAEPGVNIKQIGGKTIGSVNGLPVAGDPLFWILVELRALSLILVDAYQLGRDPSDYRDDVMTDGQSTVE